MIINHKFLIKFELLILFFSKIYNFLNPFSRNEIRILIYHHIEEGKFSIFENQLNYFRKKNWNFISPNQFENHILGNQKLRGRNLLLTFDDGMSSNFLVAEKILKRLEIQAIFFVPSEFIKIKDNKEAMSFMRTNILDQDLPKDFISTKNMNFENLNKLLENGHSIGAHTKTHPNLAEISNQQILEDEIIKSAEMLEKKLNIKINHFAFTYGNYKSISEKSLRIALSKFRFIHSSLRGNNFSNNKKDIIKRDAIYMKYGNNFNSIFLSGIIDIRYFFQISQINKLIKKLLNYEFK